MTTMSLPRAALGALFSAIGLQSLVASPVLAAAPPAAVPAIVSRDAVPWDLVFEAGNRRCRLFLRVEARAGGYAVGMPPACHLAFPSLATVTNWSSGPGEHVAFRDEAGRTVLDFAPSGTAALVATTGQGEALTFTPIVPAVQEAIRAAPLDAAPAFEATPDTTSAVAKAATTSDGVLVERSAGRAAGGRAANAATAPTLPPASASEVAGNYAVFRLDRDTGCMVTLEPAGGRADARARLAPGCRDQGIVIFDPVAWHLARSALVLAAKRGHTTELTRSDAKTWSNAPARGAALVLKRL